MRWSNLVILLLSMVFVYLLIDVIQGDALDVVGLVVLVLATSGTWILLSRRELAQPRLGSPHHADDPRVPTPPERGR